MVRADDVADADVVVLNTCCIRENADNKLYGNLGQLKSWKQERDGRQIVVSGCLAQKDRQLVRQKASHVDVVMGTHNVHRAAELLGVARSAGPVTEIFDAAVIDDHAMFPSALPVVRETTFRAWVTIQIGCDNRCAFCIVPSVRGDEISRPFEQIVDEVSELAAGGVTEITLLGQNVNSYGRDLQLAARRSGDRTARVRPLFADLLRADRRRRRDPPGPLHIAAPEGHATRDVRRDGGDAGGVPAPALSAAVRRRPDPRRDAPRLQRLALPRQAGGCSSHGARPGRVDGHHRRLPRGDGRRLRGHVGSRRGGPVRRRVHVHLLATSWHGSGRPDGSVRRPGRGRRALRPAADRRRAQRAGRQPGPCRAHRGSARGGPEQEGPHRR